jgi:molybdopterin-guanine dinucleotide biosynthesis protein A
MTTGVGTWDAIVLAGGRGRRLGGIDKPALLVGGRSLLDTALAACSGARVTVVVGPRRATVQDVRWTLESPPGSGPLAALAAGVVELGTADASGMVVVLAADLPSVDARVVGRLLVAAQSGVDGAVVVDGTGRVQPLLAAYRRPALDRALQDVHDPRNRPVRSMLDRLRLVDVVDAGAAADIDTPDDLARWADA